MWKILGECLFKVLRHRKCKIRAAVACLLIFAVLHFLSDFLHSSHSSKQNRRHRIHKYFINISRFTHFTPYQNISSVQYGEDHMAMCTLRELPLWTPEAKKYIRKPQPIVCNDDENWVYTKDGRFYISSEAAKKHGRIHCVYIPIVNVNDSYKELKPIVPMLSGSTLVSDAFKVTCKAANGKRYVNIHTCISQVKKQRFRRGKDDDFNIFIFGFDSLSRHMLMRLLPKTHDYFTKTLGGKILQGYNIVGDGTPQALMPLLTGKQETEIPEVRRGKAGAHYVDDVLTFFWTRCEKKGYVTQWGEDMAHMGTFNLRMLGFRRQPVHHYMRPFHLAAIPMYPYFKRNCLGSQPRFKVYLDWLKEGFVTNQRKRLFTFGFFAELSHDNNNPIVLMDEDNVNFLEFMHNGGFLNDTIMIMMSDHGTRFGPLRSTEQGKLEERLPYFGFRFPEKFQRKFPQKVKVFEENIQRLVTPFDVHETLLDIIGEKNDDTTNSQKGISLFKRIPENRTCADAGVEPHWCACLKQSPIPVSDRNVVKYTWVVLKEINHMLQPFNEKCHKLELDSIMKANKLETNDKVLKFRKTLDADGRVPDMSDSLKARVIYYQITFVTQPGSGMFETTVAVDTKSGSCKVDKDSISRINKYGDAPWCIVQDAPRLRPYCVCRERQLS